MRRLVRRVSLDARHHPSKMCNVRRLDAGESGATSRKGDRSMHADSVRLAVLLALYGSSVHTLPVRAAEVPPVPTGPRVPAHDAALPVRVYDRAQIARTGLVSLGDFLQQLPGSGATINTKYNGGGDGSIRV